MKKQKREIFRLPDLKRIKMLENKKNHFAAGMNFYKLFWIFFIGCFLGVVIETLWCLITRFHYESRVGLIYGPFNLVYGFGTLAMAVSLHWMRRKRDLVILVGGVIIGSIIEYICSFIQEIMFGTVSWNYEAFPFNINGRINLLYSLFWGILAILWIKVLYPMLTKAIMKIPNRIGKQLTWILLIFMIFNTVMSGLAVERWTQRREGVKTNHKVWQYFDKYYTDERMKDIYPNMIFKE